MPKMKTHSGAKKRFKLTGSGKLTRRHGMRSHILEKKTPKRKRAFRSDQPVEPLTRSSSRACSGCAEGETAMTRVKRSVHARKKRRKVLSQASGYWGLKSKVYRRAKEQVQHSLQYAYRDRRVRKRDFRRLWIVRINAAARLHGLSYSQLINGLKRAEVAVDRKVLADLAVHEPKTFAALAERAKAALAQ